MSEVNLFEADKIHRISPKTFLIYKKSLDLTRPIPRSEDEEL